MDWAPWVLRSTLRGDKAGHLDGELIVDATGDRADRFRRAEETPLPGPGRERRANASESLGPLPKPRRARVGRNTRYGTMVRNTVTAGRIILNHRNIPGGDGTRRVRARYIRSGMWDSSRSSAEECCMGRDTPNPKETSGCSRPFTEPEGTKPSAIATCFVPRVVRVLPCCIGRRPRVLGVVLSVLIRNYHPRSSAPRWCRRCNRVLIITSR